MLAAQPVEPREDSLMRDSLVGRVALKRHCRCGYIQDPSGNTDSNTFSHSISDAFWFADARPPAMPACLLLPFVTASDSAARLASMRSSRS